MLITGGSGFLGRHLTRGVATKHWEIVAPSSSSVDIRRKDSTIAAIRDWKPSAVVNLAYRKGDRPAIVDGAQHVAEGAEACGARLVHMSTDVIFPGRASAYVESDAPFPMTDYGTAKRDAEVAVMKACPTAVMIRTSLLYGTGELAPLQLDVRRALTTGADHQPMTFFTDEFRCPAHADDVAAAIAELATRRDVTGPIHVAGPEAISRAELARFMASWLGLDSSGLLTSTISASGLARPARIVLDTSAARELGITCRSLATAVPSGI